MSANQLKNLADAKAKIMALPSMQGEGVRDFYDQIFDRVPAAVDPGCPHCRAEVAARELEDYEAMGRAGDLGVVTEVGEVEVETSVEKSTETEMAVTENEYAGAWLGPREQEVGS